MRSRAVTVARSRKLSASTTPQFASFRLVKTSDMLLWAILMEFGALRLLCQTLETVQKKSDRPGGPRLDSPEP